MPHIKIAKFRMEICASLPKRDDKFKARWIHVFKVTKNYRPINYDLKLKSNEIYLRIGSPIFYGTRIGEQQLNSCGISFTSRFL